MKLKELDESLYMSLFEEEGIDDKVTVHYHYAYNPHHDDDDDEDDYDDEDDEDDDDDHDEDDDDRDDDDDYEDDDKEDNMDVTHDVCVGRECVKTMKSNPANVPIAQAENGRYYMDMTDVLAYTEAAGLDEVEGAVDNIAEANDITADEITIVLPENAEEIYGERMMAAMDESTLSFEM